MDCYNPVTSLIRRRTKFEGRRREENTTHNGSSPRILRHILDQENVEIEARDLSGESALTLAAYKGKDDVVQLLLDKCALPNTRIPRSPTYASL